MPSIILLRLRDFINILKEEADDGSPPSHHKYHDLVTHGYGYIHQPERSSVQHHAADSWENPKTKQTEHSRPRTVSHHYYKHPETGHEIGLHHDNVDNGHVNHSWSIHPEGTAKEHSMYSSKDDSSERSEYHKKYSGVLKRRGSFNKNVFDDPSGHLPAQMAQLHGHGPKEHVRFADDADAATKKPVPSSTTRVEKPKGNPIRPPIRGS